MAGTASRTRRSRGRLWIAVPLAAAALYASLLVIEQQGAKLLPGERWLSDPYDAGVYWKRAGFVSDGGLPYRDTFSEYPVFATLTFALPLAVVPGLDVRTYRLVWALLMLLPFAAILLLIQRAREEAGLPAWPVALMASPSVLYFSLNRFDVLPALVCVWSLLLFHRRRFAAAHVLLGVGVHLKWYPAVLFPVYLAHQMQTEGLFESRLRGLLHSRSLRLALVFAGTVLLITLICIAAFGWDGFARTYRFHAGRGAQWFNLYWLADRCLVEKGWDFSGSALSLAFLAGQVSIVGVLLVKRLRTPRDVDRYAVLAVVLFIAFAKVDSPQWILWYVPLALTFVRRRETLAALLLLTLLSYAVFPLAFDGLEGLLVRRGSPLDPELAFSAVVVAKDIALVAAVTSILLREGSSTGGGR